MATTWAPLGQTPVLRRPDKRRAISTLLGLTTTGRILRLHFEHSIGGEEVVRALRHFRRHIRGRMIILWDGLQAHRSAVVKQYLARHPEIVIEPLPSYAPEINAEEYCHGYIKRRMKNAIHETAAQIQHHVDREIRRLRRKPGLIRTFFQRAGLKLTSHPNAP